jgi:hypothetical protein
LFKLRNYCFFVKKQQKTFIILRLGLLAANATDPDSRKFLRRFFQKAALLAWVFIQGYEYHPIRSRIET